MQQEPEQLESLPELLLRANKTPVPAIAINAVSIKTFFFMIFFYIKINCFSSFKRKRNVRCSSYDCDAEGTLPKLYRHNYVTI